MCSFKTEQKKSGEARTDGAKYVISEQFSQDLCAELFRKIMEGLEKKIFENESNWRLVSISKILSYYFYANNRKVGTCLDNF